MVFITPAGTKFEASIGLDGFRLYTWMLCFNEVLF